MDYIFDSGSVEENFVRKLCSGGKNPD